MTLSLVLIALSKTSYAYINISCDGARVSTFTTNEPSISCSNTTTDAVGNIATTSGGTDLRTGNIFVSAISNSSGSTGLNASIGSSINEKLYINGTIPDSGIDIDFGLNVRGRINSVNTNNQVVFAGFSNLLSTAVNSLRPNSNDRSTISFFHFNSGLGFSQSAEDEQSIGDLRNLSDFFINLKTSTTIFPDTEFISLITQVNAFSGDTRFSGPFSTEYNANLSVDLPAGVNLTSRSGHLLTNSVSVPEPSSLILMLIGLIASILSKRIFYY